MKPRQYGRPFEKGCVEFETGAASGLAAWFHTALCTILRFLVTIDQLDPLNTLAAELLVRYLAMLEAACDRNPKQPDWEGLDVLIAVLATTNLKPRPTTDPVITKAVPDARTPQLATTMPRPSSPRMIVAMTVVSASR